ncbi:hypothetical protein GOBAR_AA29932 [Gossypium barbadense]|uniref:Uncharacterized protein n=1 Tax=Gossypium barbadense TaxID=3634 RepID=A0A2P5WI49_GOSBA|nr:hypothetical protein GOBAR_AA29932 [Gossypium barbadense]
MVQPTLQEMSLKEVHEPFSSSSRGPIHEDRRLQIKELDEWRMHKPRTHDKPTLHQNELNTSPNQLKVGDKVLLDAADPHIVTTKPNEEIPLTILSIFPFGTVEVSHPKFGTFKVYHTDKAKHTGVLMTVWKQGKDFPNTGYEKSPWPCDMAVGEPAKTAQACDTYVLSNLIKSSKAHYFLGTRNSTGKGPQQLPCPARP